MEPSELDFTWSWRPEYMKFIEFDPHRWSATALYCKSSSDEWNNNLELFQNLGYLCVGARCSQELRDLPLPILCAYAPKICMFHTPIIWDSHVFSSNIWLRQWFWFILSTNDRFSAAYTDSSRNDISYRM